MIFDQWNRPLFLDSFFFCSLNFVCFMQRYVWFFFLPFFSLFLSLSFSMWIVVLVSTWFHQVSQVHVMALYVRIWYTYTKREPMRMYMHNNLKIVIRMHTIQSKNWQHFVNDTKQITKLTEKLNFTLRAEREKERELHETNATHDLIIISVFFFFLLVFILFDILTTAYTVKILFLPFNYRYDMAWRWNFFENNFFEKSACPKVTIVTHNVKKTK